MFSSNKQSLTVGNAKKIPYTPKKHNGEILPTKLRGFNKTICP